MFYEKGIDNLDTVIEEASHTIENMEMLFMGSVYDLAKFDEQDFVDEYLSECYAEAYDEKLDYYVDKTNNNRICSHISYWIIKLNKKLIKFLVFNHLLNNNLI